MQQQVQFLELLEKLPAGAYICDLDGLITYFNQQAVQIWGRTPASKTRGTASAVPSASSPPMELR